MSDKKKIIIIEDEKTLLELLSDKLGKAGYEVLTAENGEDGLAAVKKEAPDLILLDIVMPKMDGYEVMERMQEEGIKIPVIIISNSGQPVEIEKTKKLGALDHLIKTQFSPEEVLAKVRKAFGQDAGTADAGIAPASNPDVRPLNIRVLLVEDDNFLREICLKKLVNEGFTVFPAIDGREAIDNIAKVKPNIVLLDIILPSVDGFQVLSEVRASQDQAIAQVPVIMLSNLGQENDIKKAMDMGASDYLVKAHFTTEEIVEKIKALLKK